MAIPAVAALGMAFPQLLRRHAGEAPRPDPAGHGGSLLALGWILLGHGLLAGFAHLPAALLGAPSTIAAGLVAAPSWPDAPLTGVALGALELIAALALLAGARGARLITVAWSSCALAAVIAGASPLIGAWFAAVPVTAAIVTLARPAPPLAAARIA